MILNGSLFCLCQSLPPPKLTKLSTKNPSIVSTNKHTVICLIELVTIPGFSPLTPPLAVRNIRFYLSTIQS